ncbi:hypothetical protein HG531_004794 [Fusarium graminearum]|nr:hypothetical protein HG531_004794 [Fusarium graminearum]
MACASIVPPETYPYVFENITLDHLYQIASFERVGFDHQLVDIVSNMRQFIIDGYQLGGVLRGLFSNAIDVVTLILKECAQLVNAFSKMLVLAF